MKCQKRKSLRYKLQPEPDEPDEFTYRLKKDTLLPYNTKLKGLNCCIFFGQSRNKNPVLDYNFCFSRSLKPSVQGYSGREGHGRMDGWWIFEVKGEAEILSTKCIKFKLINFRWS